LSVRSEGNLVDGLSDRSLRSRNPLSVDPLSIELLSVRSERLSISGKSELSIDWLSIRSHWLSVWSEGNLELSIEWLSRRSSIGVGGSSIERTGVGVGVGVGIAGRSVQAVENARHFFVVGNTTQWVLAETPSSHVSIAVSGNCTPREGHTSVGRKDSVSGATRVALSVAIKRECARVDELGAVNGSGLTGISIRISSARRTNSHRRVRIGSGCRGSGSRVSIGSSRGSGSRLGRVGRVSASVGVGVWSVNIGGCRGSGSRSGRNRRRNECSGESRSGTRIDGGIKTVWKVRIYLFNATFSKNARAKARTKSYLRVLGVQANNRRV
jgi:hypothetical protein